MGERDAVKRTGGTTIQHKPPFADENVLMIDRQAQIKNLAIGGSLECATSMQVVMLAIGT